MSITVFLGAGAAIDIGGPSTSKITEAVKSVSQQHVDRVEPIIRNVADILGEYYREDVNFEDIFHALEQITTYKAAWRDGVVKDFKPPIGAFTKPKTEDILGGIFKDVTINDIMVNIAKYDLIKKVAELINEYNLKYHLSPVEWHDIFWRKLSSITTLTVATLNYDTCIERSLDNYEDGFDCTEYDFKKFNLRKLLAFTGHKILHLHGCINYGYPPPNVNPNRYTLTSHFEELYLHENHSKAKLTWSGRSGNVSQSGENSAMGPIITGLFKADKIQITPYMHYYTELLNSIIRSNSLLVIGYSFGDKHFNRILEQVSQIHSDKRRVVFIMWADRKNWYPDYLWQEVLNHEAIVNISKAFQDYRPINNFRWENPIISKDGKARVYWDGFKNTIEKHGEEIISFLTT